MWIDQIISGNPDSNLSYDLGWIKRNRQLESEME